MAHSAAQHLHIEDAAHELRPQVTVRRDALALADAGSLERAIEKLRAVTQANPKNGLAHDRLGELLLRANRPKQALVPLLAMIEQGHENLNLHIQLARAYGMLGEFDRALSHLARYEALFTGDDRIRTMRDETEQAKLAAESDNPPR